MCKDVHINWAVFWKTMNSNGWFISIVYSFEMSLHGFMIKTMVITSITLLFLKMIVIIETVHSGGDITGNVVNQI